MSQGVELARMCAHGAAGLANAVLRRVAEGANAFLTAEDASERHRAMVSCARRAGLPTWLVRRIIDSLGEERAQAMFACQLEPAPIAVQVNPLRSEAVEDALAADGARSLELPGAYAVDRVSELVRSNAFAHADAVASDYHAQLIAAAVTREGVDSLGEERAQAMFACQLEPAPIAVQVNPLRSEAVEDALASDGARSLELPGAYAVDRVSELVRSNAFAHADAVASDYHAQLIAAAVTREGSCLEIGAGRGTKTFMMLAHAERRNLDHEHVALDLYEGKCQANAQRIAVDRVSELVRSNAFAHADAVASDYHAQLIAAAVTREGSCLEIGAGRGTKTFMMLAHAERRNLDHEHVALDLYEGKCQANAQRIECSGLGEMQMPSPPIITRSSLPPRLRARGPASRLAPVAAPRRS